MDNNNNSLLILLLDEIDFQNSKGIDEPKVSHLYESESSIISICKIQCI